MHAAVASTFAALLVLVSPTALAAQSIERPVPFDSAHRVLAITPAVADRLRLQTTPGVWPVQGSYREARLYSVEPGGSFTLVVQRSDGALERIALTPEQRSLLGGVVDAGMTAAGRPSAELAADVVSQPAGNAFAARLTALSAFVYAPIASSLATDPSTGAALYLLVTGGAFFASYGAAQSTPFTRAQSDLAGNLGLSGATSGWLLGYAASGNSDRPTRAASFGGAVIGTIVGASLGRSLSDAEAHAATLGIEATAVATAGAAGVFDAPRRATAGGTALLGGFGYLAGVGYPRRVAYNVTAGDVEAVSTSGLVGALYGAIIVTSLSGPSTRQVTVALAPAYLAGILVGDRIFARRFDLTQPQANVLNIGAVAGALVGLAAPALAGADPGIATGAAAVGATLGMAAIASTFHSQAAERLGRRGDPRGQSSRFHVIGVSAIAATAGLPGRHVLATLSF
jgi:hypothetical protein